MIDYWEKEVEFCIYDYPYNNDNLKSYKIGDMTISHKKESIDIKFSIKDLILAVGILECKLSKINLMYEDEIDIWIVTNECKGGFMYNNLDKILYKTIILTCEDIEFSVRSKTYNLEEEMGIICYYDLNDIYEDEILEGILREIKDIYMS